MARAVLAVLEALRVDDQQLLVRKAAQRGRFLQRLTQMPVVEPVLTIVVVEREQPSDPHHWAPLVQPENIGDAPVLVADDKAVQFVKVTEDRDGLHPALPHQRPPSNSRYDSASLMRWIHWSHPSVKRAL